MTDPRQAMQMALEAMNDVAHGAPCFGKPVRDAMDALRAALSAQQEPWGVYLGHRQTPEGTNEFWGSARHRLPVDTLLYTNPAPTVQPLTDEQIKAIHNELCDTVGSDFKTVARAIERAHGIGGT